MTRAAAGSRAPVRTRALSTPRISYVEPKRSYVHVPSGPRPAVGCALTLTCAWSGCGLGGYREGGIPGSTQPVSDSGILVLPGPNQCQDPPICVHRALQGPPGPSAHPAPRTHVAMPQGPKRARFRVIYLKVSHNPRVSPKYTHEACHSPCFKKRVPKVTTLNS